MVRPATMNADELPRGPRALDVRCAWEPPDTVVATFDGDFERGDVRDLDHLLRNEVQATGARVLAVDAADLGFVNSIGLGCLARLARDLRRDDRRLEIRRPSGNLQRLLVVVGLEALLVESRRDGEQPPELASPA